MLEPNQIVEGDSLHILKQIDSESIDSIVTDPPYGYSFMNKDWDKAVVSVDIWKECLRVLKHGAFAFIMSSPRQDVLCKMILNLIDAGFETNFTSIYWTYASGFPKAANVSKLVDKRYKEKPEYHELAKYLKESRETKNITIKELAKLFPSKTGGITGCVWNWENGQNVPTESQYEILKQKLGLDNRFDWLIHQETKRYEEAEREIIAQKNRVNAYSELGYSAGVGTYEKTTINITKSATEAAKRLDGSYAGFQPKPALETILVVMKPLSEKSYVDQALKNGKGCTWLDDCRIPFQNESDIKSATPWSENGKKGLLHYRKLCESQGYDKLKKIPIPKLIDVHEKGRFPANLLCSDDSLNDGKITKSNPHPRRNSPDKANVYGKYNQTITDGQWNDSGSYSRYFDLDAWYNNAQFIITPKASASERNKGLENSEGRKVNDGRTTEIDNPFQRGETIRQNSHPTVKPLKLMCYLITLGSRPNDIILDPFVGSGTTAIAALQLSRRFIGIEQNKEYVEIANKRLSAHKIRQTNLLNF